MDAGGRVRRRNCHSIPLIFWQRQRLHLRCVNTNNKRENLALSDNRRPRFFLRRPAKGKEYNTQNMCTVLHRCLCTYCHSVNLINPFPGNKHALTTNCHALATNKSIILTFKFYWLYWRGNARRALSPLSIYRTISTLRFHFEISMSSLIVSTNANMFEFIFAWFQRLRDVTVTITTDQWDFALDNTLWLRRLYSGSML